MKSHTYSSPVIALSCLLAAPLLVSPGRAQGVNVNVGAVGGLNTG